MAAYRSARLRQPRLAFTEGGVYVDAGRSQSDADCYVTFCFGSRSRVELWICTFESSLTTPSVSREQVELVHCCRIALHLSSLGGGLQVRGDLLRDLLVLGWVRLLKLRAHQLGEGRKLLAVCRDTTTPALLRLFLQDGSENRLQIAVGNTVDASHVPCVGILIAVLSEILSY